MIALNEQVTAERNYSQAIVDTVRDSLLVLDKNFRIKFANRNFYKTFQVNEREAEGKLLYNLGNKQWNIPKLRKLLEVLLPEKESLFDYEVTVCFENIGQRTMLLNAREIDHSKEGLILLAIEDITKSKQAERGDALLGNIVDSSDDAIISKTLEGVITSWNKGAEKIFGYSPAEAIGKNIRMLIPPEIIEEEDMVISKIKRGESVLHYETVRLSKEGRRVSISLTISPIKNKKGVITGASKIARDITEQIDARKKIEESEANFRQLAELMPDKVSNADAQGNITYYNQHWLDFTGFNFEELKDWGWKKIIYPDDLPELTKRWQHSLTTGDDFEMELRIINANGEPKWHLSRSIAIKDNNEKVTKWITTTTDIHDQKMKEEQKDEFIGIASHEMKTPLTTAKAYIQLLQQSMEQTNDKNLIFVQKANASINRLNNLIGELLDVSKIKHGKLALNIAPFNFNEMIAMAIESVQYISPSHNIIKSGEIDEPVTGDKERLEQVMINLLSNAAKYSPKADKIFITVTKENQEVKVSVKDSGIGIRKENFKRVFERYFRESNSQFQGLGIGLSISYEIIQRHKGKIWVQSEPGKGSTFYFTIPI